MYNCLLGWTFELNVWRMGHSKL